VQKRGGRSVGGMRSSDSKLGPTHPMMKGKRVGEEVRLTKLRNEGRKRRGTEGKNRSSRQSAYRKKKGGHAVKEGESGQGIPIELAPDWQNWGKEKGSIGRGRVSGLALIVSPIPVLEKKKKGPRRVATMPLEKNALERGGEEMKEASWRSQRYNAMSLIRLGLYR